MKTKNLELRRAHSRTFKQKIVWKIELCEAVRTRNGPPPFRPIEWMNETKDTIFAQLNSIRFFVIFLKWKKKRETRERTTKGDFWGEHSLQLVVRTLVRSLNRTEISWWCCVRYDDVTWMCSVHETASVERVDTQMTDKHDTCTNTKSTYEFQVYFFFGNFIELSPNWRRATVNSLNEMEIEK